MKIPAWFVIGCGLLVLNLVLVLGGSLSRHASAKSPQDQLQKQVDSQSATDSPKAVEAPPLPDAGSLPPTLNDESKDNLPTVPSLESVGTSLPNVVSLDDVANAVGELRSPADLLAPLDAIMKDAPSPVSEQLSHSFFESMKLRLNTVDHLNQSAIGLVEEAAILYQRGEIAEAKKLLGLATQLREMTARLLVTHQ